MFDLICPLEDTVTQNKSSTRSDLQVNTSSSLYGEVPSLSATSYHRLYASIFIYLPAVPLETQLLTLLNGALIHDTVTDSRLIH